MSSVLEAAVTPPDTGRFDPARREARRTYLGVPVFSEAPRIVHVGRRVEVQRRLVNVVAAIALLVIVAPLMAVIALVIRVTSTGPVIYKQTRVGVDRRAPGSVDAGGRRLVDYGGTLFTIYKFRTMRADPDSGLQIWAKPNDARVTAVGRVLRKYRLDELPQLCNVIRGDMNLVGPRPEQPNIFMSLREAIDRYPERQRVLPGITGWAQINHPYDRTIVDVRRKLWYDLEYMEKQSSVGDVMILLRTIPVILFQRGAW